MKANDTIDIRVRIKVLLEEFEAIGERLSNAEQSEALNLLFRDKPMVAVYGVDHTLEPVEQVRQMVAILTGIAADGSDISEIVSYAVRYQRTPNMWESGERYYQDSILGKGDAYELAISRAKTLALTYRKVKVERLVETLARVDVWNSVR